MPDDRTQPLGVGDRREREPADGVLPALMVGVQELHPEDVGCPGRLEEALVLGIVSIADRRLPKTDVVAGDIEVPELLPELVGLGVRMRVAQVRHDVPSLDHGDARSRVAQRHRQVDVATYLLHDGAAAGEPGPVLVSPHDLLDGILEARGMSSGRMPICMEYSATRAARLAARTATNVASASTSVPTAVASDAAVDQSPSRERIAGPPTVIGEGGHHSRSGSGGRRSVQGISSPKRPFPDWRTSRSSRAASGRCFMRNVLQTGLAPVAYGVGHPERR
jgi:hypothetical protein